MTSGETITGIGCISVVFYVGIANLANGFGFIQRLCLLILFESKIRPYTSLQTWRGVDYLLLSSCLLLFWSTTSCWQVSSWFFYFFLNPALTVYKIHKIQVCTLRLIDIWAVLGLFFHPSLSYVLLNYPIRLTWGLEFWKHSGSTIVNIKLVPSDQNSLCVGKVDDSWVTTLRMLTPDQEAGSWASWDYGSAPPGAASQLFSVWLFTFACLLTQKNS